MFLLFAGDDYYPSGGWLDLEGSFDSLEDAQAAAAEWAYTVEVGAQPARTAVLYAGTNGSGGVTDIPAKPAYTFVRHRRGWAHIVHEDEIVSEWSSAKPVWVNVE